MGVHGVLIGFHGIQLSVNGISSGFNWISFDFNAISWASRFCIVKQPLYRYKVVPPKVISWFVNHRNYTYNVGRPFDS